MIIMMHLIKSNLACLSNSQKLQPAAMASEEKLQQWLIKTGSLWGNLNH